MTDNTPLKLQGMESEILASFEVRTLMPKWCVMVSIHPTSDALKKFGRYRFRNGHLCGATWFMDTDGRQEGVLAEIHLVADRLSELTVVHEAVHVAAHLARTIGVMDAKNWRHASPRPRAPSCGGTRFNAERWRL